MIRNSRELVDPELLDALDVWEPPPPLSLETLAEYRARMFKLVGIENDAVATKLSMHSVKGLNGAPDVPVRVYQPAHIADTIGCIFHVHGGGYVSGDSARWEAHHREITAALGCIFVSVDYRLAPETCFPGNIEDCYAALSWLFSHVKQFSVDPHRIGVMGESAGGGLAAALALLARDRGEFRLAFQHLIYPMLDDRTCLTEDPHPFTGEFIWTPEQNLFGWSALLGTVPSSGSVSPYAVPARADNLAGLPPTFISTAALDVFLEEDIEYARRLLRAGVPVELHVYPGAFHGFDFHPTAKIAQAARRDSFAALARFLGRS